MKIATGFADVRAICVYAPISRSKVMSDTAYENHGKFRLGLPADPLA